MSNIKLCVIGGSDFVGIPNLAEVYEVHLREEVDLPSIWMSKQEILEIQAKVYGDEIPF